MITEEIVSILIWLINGCASEQAREVDAVLGEDALDRQYPMNNVTPRYEPLEEAEGILRGPENEDGPRRHRTFLRSVMNSLRTSMTIMLVALPLAGVAVIILYIDLNTTDLCMATKNENTSLSFSIERWQFLGESIQVIPINLWFAATIAMLFGWKEFKENYLVTVAIGLVVGGIIIIYKSFSVIFGLFGKGFVYRFPANIIYFAGLISSSAVVARTLKARDLRPGFKSNKKVIGVTIAMPFVLGFVWALLYRDVIVPTFNSYDDELMKAVIAAISPLINIPAIGVGNYIALKASCGMVDIERSFIFVYFLQSIPISLYRIMQAEFKSLWLFVGLSLLHNSLILIFHATRRLRLRMWRFVIKCSKKLFFCCAARENVQFDTAQNRRLNADLEIQTMLFQYNAFILSQAFIVLSNFQIVEVSLGEELVEQNVYIRLAIGLGVEFVFDCIAIFIQIHFYDIPIDSVWSRHWLRHVIANVVLMIISMCYFAQVMLSVFHVSIDHSQLRNCSMPFRN